MKVNNEYILCAAIWYKEIPIKKDIPENVRPVNCDKGLVFCGYRHGRKQKIMALTLIK